MATSRLVALIAASMSAPVFTPAVAQERTETESRNVRLALDMFDAGWGANEGWEDVWRANLAPRFTSRFHAFAPIVGIENAIAFNRDLFTGFPNLEVTVEHVTAEGDSVVVRGRLEGEHEGPFLGAPASGAAVDVPDVTLFRVEDAAITEMRYFTDLIAVMTATGAIPPMR